MNVRWTEAALADLRAAEATIARHPPRYALATVERILDRSAERNDHPQLGSVVEEYGDESLRELFEDPYRILYRVLDDRVDVVAVVHAARRLPRGM